MTKQEKIDYILRAMERDKGDDLERANAAFRNCTKEQMREQYGQSGKTRYEIIDEYCTDRSKWIECKEWLTVLFREAR